MDGYEWQGHVLVFNNNCGIEKRAQKRSTSTCTSIHSMAEKWEKERLFNKQSWEKGYLGVGWGGWGITDLLNFIPTRKLIKMDQALLC